MQNNREQALLPRMKALTESAKAMRVRLEKLEAIAILYSRSIENGVYPGKDSPCHQQIKALIGEIGNKQEKTA